MMMRQPPGSEASFGERVFASFQSVLPTRAISAFMFHVAQIRSRPFKNALMRWFVHRYAVELGAYAAAPRELTTHSSRPSVR